VTICLPDEINALRAAGSEMPVRPLVPAADDALPLYVAKQGASVGISGEVFQIRENGSVIDEARAFEVSHVALFGNVQMSAQALRAAFDREIPVFFLTYGAWLAGIARAVSDHSLDLRLAQHAFANDPERCTALARVFVAGKVQNQRTMIRRGLGRDASRELQQLSFLADRIERAESTETLLGLEGNAAKLYFEKFAKLLKDSSGFDFAGRNRRPPTDPVNALLSFLYALLLKECVAAALSVGFEVGLGFYHALRPGRPSLALDLMEEFRPIIADSTVLSLINMQEVRERDFLRRGVSVVLTEEGRKKAIRAFERRLNAEVIHPVFGYTISYRRILQVQARLLARYVQGDVPAYPVFTTR
jgi:CRISP-associated protein Cas1